MSSTSPMKQHLYQFLTITSCLCLAACASTTSIRSSDKDVKIFVDDEYRGKGTVTHTDKKFAFSKTSVRMEKPGCEPIVKSFSRDEQWDIGASVGAFFLLIPALWIKEYQPEHHYDFSCLKQAS